MGSRYYHNPSALTYVGYLTWQHRFAICGDYQFILRCRGLALNQRELGTDDLPWGSICTALPLWSNLLRYLYYPFG